MGLIRKRYQVAYAHYDGNTYTLALTDSLREAQEKADDAIEGFKAAGYNPSLPVMVWDRDNEERGDISHVCPACAGSGVMTDANGIQYDDPCPECAGDGERG